MCVREDINVDVLKVALITLKKMKKLVKSTSKGEQKPFTLYKNEYKFNQNISFETLFNDISSMVITKKYPHLNVNQFSDDYKSYANYLSVYFFNSIDVSNKLVYQGESLRNEITYLHHLIDNINIDISKKDHDWNKYAEKMLYTDNVLAA